MNKCCCSNCGSKMWTKILSVIVIGGVILGGFYLMKSNKSNNTIIDDSDGENIADEYALPDVEHVTIPAETGPLTYSTGDLDIDAYADFGLHRRRIGGYGRGMRGQSRGWLFC